MRTLTLIAIAVLSVPSCTRYMHDGHRCGPAYRAHAGSYEHAAHGAPCDRAGVIGLLIGRPDDAPRSPLVVERVAPGGPADDANIRPGDRILEIDGESTRGMTEAEAARLIRGRVDTAVEIRIDSPRGDRIITLVRVAPSSVWGMPEHPRGEQTKKGGCKRECRAPCESRAEEQTMVQPQHDGEGEPEDEGGDR